MNNIDQYEAKLSEFLPLLPAQEEVAERIIREMTKDLKVNLWTYRAWQTMRSEQ